MAFNFKKQLLATNSSIGDIVRLFNSVVNNLNDIFSQQANTVQNNSVLIQNVQLHVGSNQILHTLGRTLTGWQITRSRTMAIVCDDQDNQALPQQYLTLVSGSEVLVDIVVF